MFGRKLVVGSRAPFALAPPRTQPAFGPSAPLSLALPSQSHPQHRGPLPDQTCRSGSSAPRFRRRDATACRPARSRARARARDRQFSGVLARGATPSKFHQKAPRDAHTPRAKVHALRRLRARAREIPIRRAVREGFDADAANAANAREAPKLEESAIELESERMQPSARCGRSAPPTPPPARGICRARPRPPR